ncbi:MAG: hypothetical protein ACTHJ5_06515 [Ilyomonas sp.]
MRTVGEWSIVNENLKNVFLQIIVLNVEVSDTTGDATCTAAD